MRGRNDDGRVWETRRAWKRGKNGDYRSIAMQTTRCASIVDRDALRDEMYVHDITTDWAIT